MSSCSLVPTTVTQTCVKCSVCGLMTVLNGRCAACDAYAKGMEAGMKKMASNLGDDAAPSYRAGIKEAGRHAALDDYRNGYSTALHDAQRSGDAARYVWGFCNTTALRERCPRVPFGVDTGRKVPDSHDSASVGSTHNLADGAYDVPNSKRARLL